MLTKEQAQGLVDALNEVGISCALYAESRGNYAEYEIALRFDRMDFARLTELLGIVELYPDAQLVLTDGRFTLA